MTKILAWLVLSLLALPASLHAQTPEEKGLAIAEEMQRRDEGWGDVSAKLKMVLRNRNGQESARAIRIRTLEVTDDGDKSLSIFDSPRDVKGTAFLSYTHAKTPDDQWLYLPALKRVKRIASANKSGPFMGSEFAYEDLTSQEIDKYRYKWLRDETLDGRETMVIERYPAYEYSGYTLQVVWVDTEMYQPVKTEFYDRKKSLLKTLTFGNYVRYLDRYWRPEGMEMINHQTGKSTSLSWSEYQFKTGLGDSDFNQNTLKRAR